MIFDYNLRKDKGNNYLIDLQLTLRLLTSLKKTATDILKL